MSELKCCPFCGGEVYFATEDYNDEITHLICCDNCDLKFYGSNSYGIKDHITKQWNRRTPMANIVEKLEEEKERTVCEGVDCDICPYTKECWGGEMSYKVILDKAINIVKQEINNGLE